MKKLYFLQFVLFLFLSFGTQAGSQEVEDVKHIIQKEIVKDTEAAICETTAWADGGSSMFTANRHPFNNNARKQANDKNKPSVATMTMNPPLKITHFDNYLVDVDINVPAGVTLKTVTLTVTPISFVGGSITTDSFFWNYNVDGTTAAAENSPTVRVQTDAFTVTDESVELSFGNIRPDDIYPEVQFAPSSYVYYDSPKNRLIDRDNLHLMHFNTPFEMADNTSFFIEIYAEPVNPNPPRPVDLQVFLIGKDKNVSFFDGNWQADDAVAQVRAINWEDTIHHRHTDNSRHHLIPLTVSDTNNDGNATINVGEKTIDVNGDFWVALYADTNLDRRAWNLKYHDEPIPETGGLRDTGYWFVKTGTSTGQSVTGLPDAHVHFARNEENVLVDGVTLDVLVEYEYDNLTYSDVELSRYYFFGEIENLPPNASSFTVPLAGVYSQTVNINWNPATDPNNDALNYNVYLYDVGTQTDVYAIVTNTTTVGLDFNTTGISSGDGVYNIRIEACDGEYCVSFFLYDIYDIGEEFVIANSPYTWAGSTDTNWNNNDNWVGGQIPGAQALAFIPQNVTNDLVIGNGVNAQAKRLSIAAGRTLTITTGGKLEIAQSLVNEAGAANLVVEPDASLIHNTPWPSEGAPATVQQHIPQTTGSWIKKSLEAANWYYIASPVGTQSISVFLEQLPDVDGNYDLYRWGEKDDLWYNYKATPGVPGNDFAHQVFMRGVGYLFAAQSTVTFSYIGSLNSGDLEFTGLTNLGGGGSGEGGTALFDKGWNLIGNPYASGIKFDNSMWESEDASVALTPKYWVDGDGSYAAYQLNDIIPPKTAFFVQVNEVGDSDASFTIDKDARAHYDSGGSKNNHPDYITLLAKPIDGQTAQTAYIRIAPDANDGFDYRFDARFQPGYAPIFFSFKGEEKLQVNAISTVYDDLSIPFYFMMNDEGPCYRICLTQNIEDQVLYLADLKLEIEHKLNTDSPYEFTADPDDDPNRFELRFGTTEEPTSIKPPANQSNGVHMFVFNNMLYIDFETAESGRNLQIIDISGRSLFSETLPETKQYSKMLPFNPGIYIINLTAKDILVRKKVVIK